MCRQILVTLSNIKFHENPFSHSEVSTCRQTGLVKLAGAFLQHLVVNMPKNEGMTFIPMVWNVFKFNSNINQEVKIPYVQKVKLTNALSLCGKLSLTNQITTEDQ
jgi:hypothetical protein